MNPNDIGALLVLTRPSAIHLLDLLLQDVTDEATLASETADRLGVDEAHALEALDALVEMHFVSRSPSGEYTSRGEAHLRGRMQDARFHVDWLRTFGDTRQADDCARALDAAWDARSADPARRKRARSFIRSASGKRFTQHIGDRTLGLPFGCDPRNLGL